VGRESPEGAISPDEVPTQRMSRSAKTRPLVYILTHRVVHPVRMCRLLSAFDYHLLIVDYLASLRPTTNALASDLYAN